MRSIGTLPDSNAAAVFGDFLVARRIGNQMDRENNGTFTVWINEEEHLETAKAYLAEYLRSPGNPKFTQAGVAAEQARQAEAKDLAAYRRRVRTAQGIFPSMRGYGVGMLSYALIFICVVVAVYSGLGKKEEFVERLFIDDGSTREFLGNVRHGEFWRLLTPIFLHFSLPHIFFNMSWIYFLGCMIEARCGTATLLWLVVAIGVGSNLGQYVSKSPFFGGMSGVVYGLTGYVWMRARYNPSSGLFIDRRSLTISMIWLVVCFTGFLGPVANGAHVGGLILGMLFGGISAWHAERNPR